jgi:Restriction endonuclease
MREAEIALSRMQWKPEYAKDERAFCEEVLAPLLRRMKFMSVRYTQGAREYGKDFTFSELTPFGVLRHYGLQAKAGDVSGEVNSAIDELVGQADDAFKMPYYDIASAEPRYISDFIIAISGRFTANAKEKIVHKIPRGLHGSLLFLDREAILELISRYWTAG